MAVQTRKTEQVESYASLKDVFRESAMRILADFGPSVQTAILYHLGQIEKVPAGTVFENPEKFSEALERIFSLGAPIIEERIIEQMQKTLGMKYERTEGTFAEKFAKLADIFEQRVVMEEESSNIFRLRALEQTMYHFGK
jgi:hypothetical protein